MTGEATEPLVAPALGLWGLEGARATLAAHRENTVWRVRHDGSEYALRFHRPGYRSPVELRSELQWMSVLSEGGLSVPRPIARPAGALTGEVGGRVVSLLTWLSGHPIGSIGELSGVKDPVALCRALGREMARLHDITDAWEIPSEFARPDWRREGLLGDNPLWGRFWEHPHLTGEERDVLLQARSAANRMLAAQEDRMDQGLIHADLLTENVMIDDGRLSFIDFDDCAFGFRDFELATFLLKMMPRDDFPDLRAALCEGYAVRRDVTPDSLDLFLLLRALTYPGWIADRLGEPGAEARSRRAIDTAVSGALTFLGR